MAVARCPEHGVPEGRTREYSGKSVKPVGYPNTAVVCGITTCPAPGLVWLETAEQAAYDRGERVFRVPNNAVKIRVE